jgi:hypothetical protein
MMFVNFFPYKSLMVEKSCQSEQYRYCIGKLMLHLPPSFYASHDYMFRGEGSTDPLVLKLPI